MMTNHSLLSPCGLHCGVCGIYQATQANDVKLLKISAKVYRAFLPKDIDVDIENLKCDGCHSERRSILCQSCSIRDCSLDKNISGCHECSSFPCKFIENFPVPNGKKIILQSVVYRKQHGSVKWANHEISRYICPLCEKILYRGATRCRNCKQRVSID